MNVHRFAIWHLSIIRMPGLPNSRFVAYLCEPSHGEPMPVVNNGTYREVIGKVSLTDLVMALNRALLEARAAVRAKSGTMLATKITEWSPSPGCSTEHGARA